ncbi:MAG: glycoside hydrolase family 30 protein [Oceanipulchritudo sp.]
MQYKMLAGLFFWGTVGLPAGPEGEVAAMEPGTQVKVYQTSRAGDRLREMGIPAPVSEEGTGIRLAIDPGRTYQTLLGIGGSFTESGAQVLHELSERRRAEVLEACFSPEGAHYSMTRIHIASCDFSVRNHTYAPVAGDLELEHFSIEPDRTWLLPMIKAAQAVEGADFRILASPWTAPPWMKDNQTWNGGKLLEEYYPLFADYLIRYIKAYRAEDIPIWGITPMNEPLGNGANWESTHFTPVEMRGFIKDHLGPAFQKAGLDTLIWIYDQNRGEELKDWTETILGDPESARFVAGTAVHWYDSTIHSHTGALDSVHRKFPDKQLIHSEGCIDAMGDDEPIGAWLEDDWYWRPEATDWGYLWAPGEDKERHPPYRPFHRYARDLIEGLNHHFTAWIDWNLLLNTRGGPNHARNYCLAPILVDSGRDLVHYTPLYYAIAHFSTFIRPGARRVHLDGANEEFLATAFLNPDRSLVVVVFNPSEKDSRYSLHLSGRSLPVTIPIPPQALQTLRIPPHNRDRIGTGSP